MEHIQTLTSAKKTLKATWLILVMTILCGFTQCKEHLENPESSDQIYLDLINEENLAKALAQKEFQSIKDIKKEMEGLAPRDISRKHLERQLASAERSYTEFNQKALYFKIRKEQRKNYARRAYEIAFAKDLPWPNQEEYSAYKATKKLRNTTLNWEVRVPKTDRYNKKEPGSASEAGHGEKSEGSEEAKPAH